MKYKLFILVVFSIMVFSPVVNVHAAECIGLYQTVNKKVSVEPRADVIIKKYRTIYGYAAVSQME